jgi:AraC-like DNA-binding protein
MNHEHQTQLAAIVRHFAPDEGSNETAIADIRCLKFSELNAKIPEIYTPSICVIVQGSKEVLIEGEIYQYSPSEFLAVSVDLPLIGHVIQASLETPYLCLQILIDPNQMSDLLVQSGRSLMIDNTTSRGIFVGKVNDVTIDAVLRLARLLETPQDIPVLAPMFLREIHYRLLNGEYGPSIAQLAVPGSHVQKIAQVIQHIRTNITQPISIKELAALAHMSVSSLHAHFRAVTAMSPLQYQKRLRLTEARQIMLAEGADATSTAYRVGYESPSQFSREYARMFGAPPMRDIESVRQVRNPKRYEQSL